MLTCDICNGVILDRQDVVQIQMRYKRLPDHVVDVCEGCNDSIDRIYREATDYAHQKADERFDSELEIFMNVIKTN